jgi:Uma2 family endonuclease
MPSVSTAMLVPPPAGTPLVPFRWTVDQFCELRKLQLFFEVRAILVRGEFYLRPRYRPQHEYAMGLLHDRLWKNRVESSHVRCQSPIVIDEHSALLPAISLVEGDLERYADYHPTTALFVVELANGSLLFDLNVKAELYASAGIPEYWILDRDSGQLHVFRDPVARSIGFGSAAYQTHRAFGSLECIAPLAMPSISIGVAELIP